MSLLNKLGNVSLSAVEGDILSLVAPNYIKQTLRREKQEIKNGEVTSARPERIAEFLGYTAASLAYLEMIAQNPSNYLLYIPVATNLAMVGMNAFTNILIKDFESFKNKDDFLTG